MVNRQFSLHT